MFKVINNDKEIICEIIATYHDDATDKDFMVYTDSRITDNKIKLYYSLYKTVDNGIKLIDPISCEDRQIGLGLIQEIVKDLK